MVRSVSALAGPFGFAGFAVFVAACSSSSSGPTAAAGDDGGTEGSVGHDAGGDAASDASKGPTIQHLVVIVQENHTFDSYFGRWCTAPTGSAPTCTTGPACCEAGPAMDPGSTTAPSTLNDAFNAARDPDHTQACETTEIDGGKMDGFVTSAQVRLPAELRLRRRRQRPGLLDPRAAGRRWPTATSSRSSAKAPPTTCTWRARSTCSSTTPTSRRPSARRAPSTRRPSSTPTRPSPISWSRQG